MASAPQTELRGYAASIAKYTGTFDPADLAEIEDFMRDEYRTLNHLSPETFSRCARQCWQAIQWGRTPAGQAYSEALTRQMMGEA